MVKIYLYVIQYSRGHQKETRKSFQERHSLYLPVGDREDRNLNLFHPRLLGHICRDTGDRSHRVGLPENCIKAVGYQLYFKTRCSSRIYTIRISVRGALIFADLPSHW
jgi:hypothetical protein